MNKIDKICKGGATRLVACLVPVALGSCGIYSRYTPTADVPATLYGDSLQATDTVGMGGVAWREFFTDARLQALIGQAIAQNTDLLAAQLRVEEAEATLRAARLAYLPSFALAPQGSVSSFDSQKAVQTYSLPMTASWEIDLFGRLRNASKQSRALLAQSRDYRQAVQSQLVAAVANNYYTLLMLDEQLAITRSTETTWVETVAATRALVEAGMANEVAVKQMEATLMGVRTSALDLQEQINQVENAMAQLLGETPRHVERGTLGDRPVSVPVSVGVPVSLLAARPDVRAAERGMEQAFYATGAARSAFYPSLTLSGSAGWTNSAGSIVINPAKFLASAIGSLTQPLFARGQLSAQLKIAKAQQETAALQFRQTLLNAGTEVNDALTAWQNARAKTDLYARQVASLEEAFQQTRLLMDHGNTTYIEVLTAQQSLLGAKLSQTANRFAETQAVVALYHALGGGAD
ncbi:MAG: TolC family protein [Prevotella sp.]